MHKYKSFTEIAKTVGRDVTATDRPVICVQGLGFVGAAMALAVANARDQEGAVLFNVVGVELPTPEGLLRAESINTGKFPFKNNRLKSI